MRNMDDFKSKGRLEGLSQVVVDALMKLDAELEAKQFSYNGFWRNDTAPGGRVFIFEVERRKGRRKNLITLRPQHHFLRVEVYWKEYDKHYFDIHDPENLPDELMHEIEEMYQKIAV